MKLSRLKRFAGVQSEVANSSVLMAYWTDNDMPVCAEHCTCFLLNVWGSAEPHSMPYHRVRGHNDNGEDSRYWSTH